jgi:hypothetical protein
VIAVPAPADAPEALAALDEPGLAVQEAQLRPPGLGRLPLLAVIAAAGVAVSALGDALSRSTRSSSQLLFWAGLVFVFAPIVHRLCSAKPRRSERLALVVLLGLALYLVKVVHDPFGFTYADELVHAGNANAIQSSHHLYGSNSILPVTAKYPGLESVAAALAATSGLGTFGAGLVVVAAARLLMMLALYLLFERIAGSARVAGLGAAVYAANANFLFFDAQFSYESLALTLLVVALFAVAEREQARGPARRSWAVAILAVTGAVAVSHHLTSYALVVVLAALALAAAAVRVPRARNPWPFALAALAATATWLTVVANTTVGYLMPVLTRAITSTIDTVSGEAAPRQLFSSNATGYRAPLLERAVGIGSVVLLAAGCAVGLRVVWRRHRSSPFALVLAVAGAAFFGLLLLRFASAAWETANRSSEFLFIGLSFVVALAAVELVPRFRTARLAAGATALSLTVVFAGGVIAGWQPLLRLSQPYVVAAGRERIDAPGRQLARWAAANLGPRQRIVASDADGRLLLAYANAVALVGRGGKDQPDAVDILQTPLLASWEADSLRAHRIAYVAVDRRRRSFDAVRGYFFDRRTDAGGHDELLDQRVVAKFDRFDADRIYDGGAIKLYRIGGAG